MSSAYRQNVEAFIKETQWELDDPGQKSRMAEALAWFARSIANQAYLDQPVSVPERIAQRLKPGDRLAFQPSHHRWTNLMSWMQCIDFRYPVNVDFQLNAGDVVVRFDRSQATPDHPKFGNFYAQIDPKQVAGKSPTNQGKGIPFEQRYPAYYQVLRPVLCLKTKAGDAFLSWTDGRQRYAKGGSEQLFIPESWTVLEPIF